MKIRVTQDDIDHGQRMNCNKCPVAKAVRRESGAICVVAGYTAIQLIFARTAMIRATSLTVDEWMRKFDKGEEPVEEFEFDLDLPTATERRGEASDLVSKFRGEGNGKCQNQSNHQ